MISQKEAVFQAICSVLNQDAFDTKVSITTEQRKQVIGIVTEGIMGSAVEFSAEAQEKHDTEPKVKGYVTGMVSNWLRKDERLNGGEKYVTKNPGSRAGSGDDKLKALKALKAKLVADGNDDGAEEVQVGIDERIAELKAAKTPKIEINEEHLPEEFKHLLSK